VLELRKELVALIEWEEEDFPCAHANGDWRRGTPHHSHGRTAQTDAWDCRTELITEGR